MGRNGGGGIGCGQMIPLPERLTWEIKHHVESNEGICFPFIPIRPKPKIVSINMPQGLYELIREVAKLRKEPIEKVFNSIIEENGQRLQNEVDSHIKFPKTSIGHLMSEFSKGI